jgi:outer membrane scaffolding protein for murein synthesis (MipA/OmpV family)
MLNPYDFGMIRVEVLRDVTSTHRGTIITPAIEYGTPLSKVVYVGMSASADYASRRFADTYYSITPAQSAASGLRRYDADPGSRMPA